MIPDGVRSLIERDGVRQLVKFCLVGASSAAIDFGLLNLLHFRFGLPVITAASISFFCAVCNGFYWNRRWTFRANQGDAKRQYPKFVLTNIVGYCLNLSIMTAVLIFAGSMGWMHVKRTAPEIIALIVSGEGKREFNALALNGAKLVATVIVTAWNFTASRFWTFRPRKTAPIPASEPGR